jgi:hypothetical protein
MSWPVLLLLVSCPLIIGLIFLVAVPRRRRIRKEMERIANDE